MSFSVAQPFMALYYPHFAGGDDGGMYGPEGAAVVSHG